MSIDLPVPIEFQNTCLFKPNYKKKIYKAERMVVLQAALVAVRNIKPSKLVHGWNTYG